MQLAVLAAVLAIPGEAMRQLLSTHFPYLKKLGIEGRIVFDAYLGAAAFFVLYWIPLPMTGLYLIIGVLLLSTFYISFNFARNSPALGAWIGGQARRLLRSSFPVTAIAALGVLFLEAWIALSEPAGNTLDAANATLWTANLLYHGHFTLTLQPYVDYPVYSPQGMTTWFALSHTVLGVSTWNAANETAPIFQGLTVLSAAYLGRKWLGGEVAPLAFAFCFAFLLSWPRLLVQGTYDFVAAFPLLFFLVSWMGDTFFVGQERVGAEALAPFLLVTALIMTYTPLPAEVLAIGILVTMVAFSLWNSNPSKAIVLRLRNYLFMVIAAIVGALPSAYLLASNGHLLSSSSATTSLTPGDLNAVLDPFVFGAGNYWVSPLQWMGLEVVQYEFVALLLAGVILLLFGLQMGLLNEGEDRQILSGLAPVLIGAGVLSILAFEPQGGPLLLLVNASEAALLFISAEGLLAACAIAVIAREVVVSWRGTSAASHTKTRAGLWLPIGVTMILVLAAVPLSATVALAPAEMQHNLGIVSNVTNADIDAMEYLSGQPMGAVLVAPGSAGEFLPAFSPDPVLFPLVGVGGGVGFEAGNFGGPLSIPFSGPSSNATYLDVVTEILAENYSSTLTEQLTTLGVHYILVTGASTSLFRPFPPDLFLSHSSSFMLRYQLGDAYVFEFEG